MFLPYSTFESNTKILSPTYTVTRLLSYYKIWIYRVAVLVHTKFTTWHYFDFFFQIHVVYQEVDKIASLLNLWFSFQCWWWSPVCSFILWDSIPSSSGNIAGADPVCTIVTSVRWAGASFWRWWGQHWQCFVLSCLIIQTCKPRIFSDAKHLCCIVLHYAFTTILCNVCVFTC